MIRAKILVIAIVSVYALPAVSGVSVPMPAAPTLFGSGVK